MQCPNNTLAIETVLYYTEEATVSISPCYLTVVTVSDSTTFVVFLPACFFTKHELQWGLSQLNQLKSLLEQTVLTTRNNKDLL